MPFVFGYGSLVNRQLRGPYLHDWPVQFIAPFRRTWNAHCLSREGAQYTALGLEPNLEAGRIGGVVFEVTAERYTQLLGREKGYYVHTARPTDFQWPVADPPISESISVFVTCDPKRPTADYPIHPVYLHNCAEGFRAISDVALDDFMDSLMT